MMANGWLRTAWGRSLALCLWTVLLLSTLAVVDGGARKKRQSSGSAVDVQKQPKMVTDDGHLIFQTGDNHNITFQPGGTGRVVVGSYDLLTMAEMVKNNVEDIKNLKDAGVPSDITQQLNQIKSDVTSLQNRVSALEGQGSGSLETRVASLEQTVQTLMSNLNLNECQTNPCQHGGTCVNLYQGYQCRCVPGYTGTTCSDDVNECSTIAGTEDDCQNSGTCVNTLGSFRCQCTANWFGPQCTIRFDDCSTASHTDLCGHGFCVNDPRVVSGTPKYSCVCMDGWQSDGTSNPACIQDIDECQGRDYPCSSDPLVQCINVPGTYYCGSCPTGYTGNGNQCSDVNECLSNNGGCSQTPLVQCINTPGSRQCGSCPAGYIGDGVTCIYTGICNLDNGGCSPYATCTENSGVTDGRVCTCNQGYTGNGVGASGCIPSSGSSCLDNPCINGRCEVYGNSYRCVCNAGWTGDQCGQDVDECASAPCQNSGTCHNLVNGYDCDCPSGFSGDQCQESQQSCGGYLNGETGYFEFPPYGQVYDHGLSCAWVITVQDSKVVYISFTRFKLETHPNCDYDFLQINDGASAAAHTIGRYCGETAPAAITSTHNQLYFWFRSDGSVSYEGFGINWSSVDPVCGEDLTGSNYGSINSPGYPGNYPNNRDCVWTVTVDAGMYMTFAFGTLQLETHATCDYDYVEIRDGLTEASTSLGKFCSSVTPAPVQTSGPYAFIRFHSDQSESDTGFHITYSSTSIDPGCGGVLTNDDAILISPNYPNPYPHNAECIWTIQIGDGAQIKFTITDLTIEEQDNCIYDYVELRDGFDETAPFVGRYCHADAIPPPFVSSSNMLWVKFASDVSVSAGGFRATYELNCGGIFTDPTQELLSPYFPNYYPHDKTCEYVINAPQGQMIIVTFITFDIEAHEECNFDYLQLHDGGTENSLVISKLCGTALPDEVSSTGNSMYLKFVTDGSIANYGFRATFRFEDAAPGGCGGQFTDDVGIFASPPHPEGYPHGAHCVYSIMVTDGYVIRLTFNSFSLEEASGCVFDYVQVYDNSTNALTPDMGRYCGSNSPPILTTTGNMMTVIFHTDSSVAREGFTASYVALDATTVCGGELIQDTGVISSPNYPADYPHNRQCVWIISAPSGQQINLNFTDFEMEQHPDCLYDFVELRNGGYETSPLLGTFCGSSISPTSYTSHSNKMYVKFASDSSLSARGFSLSFDGTATGCGGELTTPTGGFVSPNYPYPYGHNAECFWLISTNQGSTLYLTFADFDLETHGTCAYDFVQVFDGLTENDDQLGTFCGTEFPAPIQSTGNALRVKFRTDFSLGGRGFQAAYQTNCDHVRLTKFSGVIESPNFPDPYPLNRDCTWIIEATEGNTVNLTFTTLTLEDHSSCNYDYIEVRDGQDDNSVLIGDRLCGQNVQPNGVFFTSTDRYLLIRFVSDSSIADAGFQASYVVNGCGGELTGNTGSLSSPNYPNQYDHSRFCTWTITVEYGHSIALTITDFDVEASNNCQFDALKVYSGRDDTGLLLTSVCNTQLSPQVVSTTGRYMYVTFRTDSTISGRGFTANYQSQDGGCGGNFSTPSGNFHSPNYPGAYPHFTDCTWLITVADEHRVQLTFQDFNLEDAGCTYDYVKLFDGPSLDYPLLLTHCGASLPDPAVIYSTGTQMFVRMLSDSSVAFTGFHASYETACGGRLDATQTGVLKTTNYPAAYPANQNCTWIIESPNPGDRVTLSFTNMDIEQSTSGCVHDYVTLYEGNDDSAPLIGQYCGNSIPAPITSFGAALTVSFVSDSSVQMTGFRAVYSTSLSVCGADFTAQSGAFASPGYPASYPGDTECVWTMQSSPGNQVQVSFSVFNLEVNCNTDYLEARVGDENGALIGRYCGPRRPSNLTAFGGMWLKFVSDPAGTGIGFLANFGQVFGGDLIASTGQISSPLYPNSYLNNLDVMWTIYVSANRRVRIRFIEFSVEPSNTQCTYDSFEVYDGPDASFPNLLTVCGATLPDPVESSGSVATVLFRTDSSVTNLGWLVEWTEVSGVLTIPPPTLPPGQCGANLLAGETAQLFSSPNFPNGYDPNLDCQWLIEADPGKTLKLQLSNVNLEAHSSCFYDYVELFNGDTIDTATSLGRFCGRLDPDPSPVYSTSNMMLAVFHSDGSINGTGFQASYQTFCGGYVNSQVGVITSPQYPAIYTDNQDCTWVIEAPSSSTIMVMFSSDFNIQSSTNCVNDYVQVLNGGDVSSPPLGSSANGRYCGTTAPAAMETSGNLLTVRFHSDSSGGARGFSLRYQAMQQGCGGQVILTDAVPSGEIMSPNYPNNYPVSIECIWVVTAPSSEAIQMDFASPFYIEPHASCDFDYLQVLDGSDQNSNQLGKLCGTTAPDTITTSGNAALLRFRTDSSVAHPGFKVTASIAICGGTVSGTSGVITSPGYPSNYESNLDCMWMVRAPDGHFVTFSFNTNFNVINSAPNCSSGDVLRVHDGRNSSAFELARACGSSAPVDFDSSSNYAFVRFTTDASQVGAGFSLSFQSSEDVCGGDLSTATGSFTSPNYPQQYAHSRVCEWRITVASGQAVTLAFDDFELEGNTQSCSYDYIEVFNGLESDAPSFGRFCGNTAPQGIASTGNTMRVVFTSDGSVAFGGFSARYDSQDQSQCGALIDISPGSQGTFSSIGYGSLNYTNNLNCQWLLANSALTNSSLYLTFDAGFDIEVGTSCRYDSVQVYAGVDSTADPVGVFCGSTVPDPIVMPQASAFVRFTTDSSQIGAGFKIFYAASSCGGVVSGSSGVITSPNFPQNYDHNDHCAWLIQAPPGTTVTLTFTSFDIELHPKCQYDYLSVRNGGTFESPQISGESPWCGSNAPASITTSSNEVLMVFMTDGSEAAGGFRLEWSTDTRGCGGTFHGNTGTFRSNNFPSVYGANEECVWVLMAETGYHIRVDFDASFNVAPNDIIQVNDGSSSNDTLLGTYSGTTAPATIVSSLNVIRIMFRSDATNQGTGFQASWSVGCGATFTGVTTARIVSPGYPGRNYEDQLSCDYLINWTPLQSLGLLFSDPFGIEVSNGCNFDGLRIWAGTDDTGTQISSLCGDQTPENILVMGPVFMRFYSDSSINDIGFGLDFEPGCGGTFTTPTGVIQTPTHLDSYRHSQNCSWVITVSDDRSVSLKFSSMDIEPHSSCAYDYIEIYDGVDSNSPMLAQRLCGTTPPTSAIVSSGSSMLVRFVSDFSVSGDGFVAAYQEVIGPSLGCGGMLNAPTGTITSVDANGDGIYESDLDCMWYITAEVNKVIQLTFTGSFSIEDSSGTCPFDYLEIHDGYGSVSPLVGFFCGQTLPAAITLSSNQAYVRFATDSSVNQAGFTLNYSSVDPICGGSFNATDVAQVITSPNYPNVYPHNTRCTWYIDAPDDTKHVRITVAAFDVEDQSNCNYDYLELRDYPESNGQTLRYCGTSVPPVFDTAGRTAKIYFMTDVSSSGTGFSLTYAIANCSKDYTGTNGRVTSPGYPLYYHDIHDCRITITTPPGSFLALYFTDFNVEYSTDCVYDKLDVYDGVDDTTPVLFSLCGVYLPDPIFLSANTAYLNFVTDASVTFAGFDITYTSSTVSSGCGGSVGGRKGSFTSPDHPFSYRTNLNCEWSIEVPTGSNQLTLDFTTLAIDGEEGVCNEDYLEVYDGSSSSDRLFGRYCGMSPPAQITASFRQLFVRFVTDGQDPPVGNTTLSGFRAVFNS